MLKRIVVPLDGSACAEQAFEYALGLAKAEGATLDICSMVDPVSILGRNLSRPLEERHVASAKAQADRVVAVASAKAQAAGIMVERHVEIGDPAAAIVARATRTNADAVVMGTHGRSGFRRLFMGSVAEEVLRTSPCPVVVVREKAASGAGRQRAAIPPIDREAPVCTLRLLELSPEDYERLHREIEAFLGGPGAELPGLREARLFGSVDRTRIVILTDFQSHQDWVRAQWDVRLGKLLEDLAISAETLEFNLYDSERFAPKHLVPS